MLPPPITSPRVRFADFEVDFHAGELRKHGRRIRLQEQPLRVLNMLLERPGEMVTREDLRLKLWPADTFVDFDHGLNSAVARLRESLNDSAEAPRFVETIPRKGYRFIGQLQRAEPNPDLPSPLPSPAKEPSWIGAHKIWFIFGSLLLVLALGLLGLGRFSGKRQPPALPPAEVVPLAGLGGFEINPAFSPDGNQIAFTEINGREDSGIYTSLVGGEKSLRLTRYLGDCCSSWSPDSKQIAFLRQRENGFEIYLVPALGGTERKIYTTSPLLYPTLDWSPDGKVLAFPQSDAGSPSTHITLLSLADLSPRSLTQPPDEYLDRGPMFSPDGSQIAFVRGTVAGVVNDVYVMPTGGGIPRRLTFGNRPISGIAWTSSGTDLVYSSPRSGADSLWRVPVAGGAPQPVSVTGVSALSPSISRTGNELAYEQSVGKDNIWRIHVQNGRRLANAAAVAIPAKGRKLRPTFSPDGKRIAFESDRLGSTDIWSCDISGANCAQVTALHGTAGTARWSPDGRSIAFEFHPNERAEVYVVDVAEGSPRQITTIPGADNLAPSWSRDAQWLYFSSKRGKDRFQLWKISMHGGSPVQVTKNGGIAAAESADGHFLYYTKYEDSGIWRMPLNGGAEERVLDRPDGINWYNWGLAKTGIYFLNRKNPSITTVDFFDFATRTSRRLWALCARKTLGLGSRRLSRQ
jgi:Tol biopolymer transport system component/DNA-binding winged helix-turn-helix (wHTH) protein